MSPRSNAVDAARTRGRVVRATVDRASTAGFEGIALRDLAATLDMSKSGVVAPFGTREQLLTEAFDSAVRTFREVVIAPALEMPPRPSRLLALLDHWVDYLVDCPFPGGCVLTTASVEQDHRPGVLRDRAAASASRWLDLLTEEARTALPHLGTDAARDLALTLNGIGMSTNQAVQLLRDPDAGPRARRAFRAALDWTG